MSRYVSIVCNGSTHEDSRNFRALCAKALARCVGWTVAENGARHLLIYTTSRDSATAAYRLAANGGVILGRIFPRSDEGQSRQLPATFELAESRRIVESGGRHVIERYWGSYVAFLHDEPGGVHHVFRDPTGNVPCYHVHHANSDVFFSHVEDLVGLLPYSLVINRSYLTHWLVLGGFYTRDTGIEGIEELPSGECLTTSIGKRARTRLWDPVEIASEPLLLGIEAAAMRLCGTVRSTVNAWSACYGKIGLRLSGGLDSSILAACLANAPSRPDLALLNFAIDIRFDRDRLPTEGASPQMQRMLRSITGGGDERYFARMVAERWQRPLIERERNLSIDLSRMWEVPLMTAPALYYTSVELDEAEMELARTLGVQAFFSGQVGDAVLHLTTHPFAAIDYAYLHGIKPELWSHLKSATRLSKQSIWSVAKKTMVHGLARRPWPLPAGIHNQPSLLTDALAKTVRMREFANLWDTLGAHLPPGKQDHTSGLAGSMYYMYEFHSAKSVDHVDPLNSQPIWELMLQLPAYTVLADGVTRGLARRAFSEFLPVEIRRRQVKGSGGAFYQRLVLKNRDFLRTSLLDGQLVADMYLDRQKLENYFASENPNMIISASQLLSYFSAEIWLQQWSAAVKECGSQAADRANTGLR